MKVTAFLVVLACGQLAAADLATVLKSWKGKKAGGLDYAAACKAMGKTYGGYGYSGSSSKMTFSLTCSGQHVDILCKGSPFNCCHSTEAPGSKEACANVKPGPTCSWGSWECPKSWSTSGGTVPDDAKDAKAFIATHNIFRCMHDVQPVVWDNDVHDGAKKWALHTGTAMVHSHSPSSYRKGSDGENLAGTFKFSKHPGVDATHMWYEEIAKDCNYQKSCYQTFTPGHFTAMMWSSVDKIAYSDTTGKLATGRYRGCDGNPPNYNDGFKDFIHVPTKNYGDCRAKVLACPAFSGLTADETDGCDSSSAASGKDAQGKWIWHMVYKHKCADKYKNMLQNLKARLYEQAPQILQPLMTNAGLIALVAALVGMSVVAVVRRRRRYRYAQASEDNTLIDCEGASLE